MLTVRLSALALALAAAALAACGRNPDAGSQLASNYPPNYMWGSQCVEDATFKLCRTSSNSHAALRIEYRGQLQGHPGLAYYVKLNGRDGVYAPEPGYDYLALTNGYTRCDYIQGSGSSWDCKDAPQAMKDLFFWARDEHGNLNDWDLEVAVVDGDGRWDSRFGANYHFRIDRATPYGG